MNEKSAYIPLVRAGVYLGIGLGGFLDGILFHQLLQVHSMFSAKIPRDSIANIEVNMFCDGVFHMLTWSFTVIGLVLLWRAVTKDRVSLSTKCFAGSMLAGWGLFNLVEGLIDHHLIGMHHVVERLGLSLYDYAFLTSGLVLIAIGWALIKAARKDKDLAVAVPAAAAANI